MGVIVAVLALVTVSSVVLMTARLSPSEGSPPAKKELGVGDMAPDFALPYATAEAIGSKPWRLSEHLGSRWVVLAFYPADFSPGCTKEMCTFRDNFRALGDLNAIVVGISGDYVWAHHAWAKSENLPFALLSDHFHEVARRYGSFDEKSGYNKRTVFAIDTKGIIRYVDREYSVRDDADFEELKKALKRPGN